MAVLTDRERVLVVNAGTSSHVRALLVHTREEVEIAREVRRLVAGGARPT